MTLWLRASLLVLVIWLLIEKLATYFSAVGYAAFIAVGGLFFAYLVYPIVNALQRRLPLWAAVVTVYCAFAILGGLAFWLLLPIVVHDLESFVGNIPRYERELRALLLQSHVPSGGHISRLAVDRMSTGIGERVREFAVGLADNVLGITLSFVSFVALVIAIPATSAYMLLEAKAIRRFILRMVRPMHRVRTALVIDQIDAVLGGFIRGQVLVAVTVAIMVSIMLLILRVPYAMLIGISAGVLDLIPYLGAVVGAVPAVLIALLTNGVVDAGLASLGFAVIFELEGNLIAPKIVSHTVGVSPLAVIFAVLVGGEAFGFAGMLVAVPVIGVIRVIIENFRPAHEDEHTGVSPIAQDVIPSG